MTRSTERIEQVADDRFAVPVESVAEGQLLTTSLRTLPALIEAVGGIQSVELMFDLATISADEFKQELADALRTMSVGEAEAGRLHEIPVHYGGEDGPDFDDVLEQLGLTREAFVERHTAVEWRVAMLGFTPGFAYLDGGDAELAVPRREAPRASVPAGSVGLAGGRTGLYALPGPGGWQLIGRTDAELFRRAAEDPFLLRAGDRVRFVAAE